MLEWTKEGIPTTTTIIPGVECGLGLKKIILWLLGAQNALVVSVGTGTLVSAQIMDKDEARVLWASPLRKRVDCTYGYSSIQ